MRRSGLNRNSPRRLTIAATPTVTRANTSGAIKDYDEAIKLDPKFANAFNSRGSAYFEKGQYDRAILDYDQAIRLDPKNPVPIRNRELTIRKKNREL